MMMDECSPNFKVYVTWDAVQRFSLPCLSQWGWREQAPPQRHLCPAATPCSSPTTWTWRPHCLQALQHLRHRAPRRPAGPWSSSPSSLWLSLSWQSLRKWRAPKVGTWQTSPPWTSSLTHYKWHRETALGRLQVSTVRPLYLFLSAAVTVRCCCRPAHRTTSVRVRPPLPLQSTGPGSPHPFSWPTSFSGYLAI